MLVLHYYEDHQDLHSFPTRRSSDLENGNDKKNNEKLLRELAAIPEEQRTARFVCALALCAPKSDCQRKWAVRESCEGRIARSEEHTSELQSLAYLVCRLLLEKKNTH